MVYNCRWDIMKFLTVENYKKEEIEQLDFTNSRSEEKYGEK